MAKDNKNKQASVAEVIVTPEVAKPVDYSTFTAEQLLAAIGVAFGAKDMKLMGALSKLYTKKEAEVEKAKKEALVAELVQKVGSALARFTALADEMFESGEYDGAEGIWFAFDAGAIREQGINPSLKLTKTGKKASSTGESSGKSSYVANPAKSADLLAQVGSNVYFAEDTTVTIDKVETVMPAGMTFKQAYDYSTNGGWRNRVRMALLKEAGII
jgi:hypothetical protein